MTQNKAKNKEKIIIPYFVTILLYLITDSTIQPLWKEIIIYNGCSGIILYIINKIYEYIEKIKFKVMISASVIPFVTIEIYKMIFLKLLDLNLSFSLEDSPSIFGGLCVKFGFSLVSLIIVKTCFDKLSKHLKDRETPFIEWLILFIPIIMGYWLLSGIFKVTILGLNSFTIPLMSGLFLLSYFKFPMLDKKIFLYLWFINFMTLTVHLELINFKKNVLESKKPILYKTIGENTIFYNPIERKFYLIE